MGNRKVFRKGLFLRMFGAFSVAMLISTVLFAGSMAVYLRGEQQKNYEAEVLGQAREIASYMSYMNRLSYFAQDASMRYLIREKLTAVRDDHQADVWLVNFSSGVVQCLDSNLNTSEVRLSGPVFEVLQEIRAGKEIRAQGIFQELGNDVVTLGVPWEYGNMVIGAVLLHVSVDALEIEISTLLSRLLPFAIMALLAGVILCWLVTIGQIRPIKEIIRAMRDFGQGKMDRRVSLKCGGEVQELGETFNRMAGEIDRQETVRRSFVANVSHELRSPLTSMRGYVQAMLDGTIPQDSAGPYLQVVMDETVRLSDLVGELLDLSRIESGKFPLNKISFDICEQMRRTLVSFAQRIEEKNISVQLEIPHTACRVNADVGRISQVLSNIVDNAIKFIPEQNGVLRLKICAQNKLAYIGIANNGPAIPQEDIPHIFERFYKVDKAHTAGMGTGLGLAICHRIIEQHGQSLQVRSDEEETEFFFTLEISEEIPAIAGVDNDKAKLPE